MTGLLRTNLTIPTPPCTVPQHLIIQPTLEFIRVGGGAVSIVDITSKWMAAIVSRSMDLHINPLDQGVPLLVSLWDLLLTNIIHRLHLHHHEPQTWQQLRRRDLPTSQPTSMVTKTHNTNHNCSISPHMCRTLDRNLCNHPPVSSNMPRTVILPCCRLSVSSPCTGRCHSISISRDMPMRLKSWPVSSTQCSSIYRQMSPIR